MANHSGEAFIIKLIAFLIILAVLINLASCTTSNIDIDHNCKITCDDCKNLQVDCDRKKEKDNKELTPTG